MAGSPQHFILIVAPDKQAGLPIAKSLKTLGYDNLSFAPDLNSAIAKLRSSPVALIVADQPEGSVAAFKLFQGLRKAAPYRNLPFAGLVGGDAAKLARAAAKDPHAVFLTKPFPQDALRKALSGLLNGSAAALPPQTPAFAAPSEAESSPAIVSQDSATRHPHTLEGGLASLEECDGKQAKTIFEAMLKSQGPSCLAYMGLANAFLLLGQRGGYRSALDRAGDLARTPAPAQAVAVPAASAAPTEKAGPSAPDDVPAAGKIHGIWHSLSPKERRQKAYDSFAPSHEKRSSLRLFVPDWQVRLADKKIELQAVDLSATGLCFEALRPPLEKGASLNVELVNRGEVVLTGLMLAVMRVENNIIGCRFASLTRQQEKDLTHLLAEEQRKGANVTDEFDKTGKKEKKVIKLSF